MTKRMLPLVFFLIGGIEAELLRIQLQGPNRHFVSAELYNQLFTMHGTTMIFLAIMPLSAAFFNRGSKPLSVCIGTCSVRSGLPRRSCR